MIDNKDFNRSLLIPKWPSIRANSLEILRFPEIRPTPELRNSKDNLNSDLVSFHQKPTTLKAADILHCAIVLGCSEVAKEMAQFLKGKKYLSSALDGLVNDIIKGDQNLQSISTNALIRETKRFLIEYPRDALIWIEQARLYTIKGQFKQARESALIGNALAPENRFVSRGAARLFVHLDELDTACILLRRAHSLNPDPMIRATQLNCEELNNGTYPDVRKSEIKGIPDAYLLFYSELICTHGILEMRSGSEKNARRLLKRSWDYPTENVIAHADWIIRNRYPGLIGSIEFDFDRSSEAATWRRYCELKMSEALEMAVKWALDEPYSTHPYMVGSAIACQSDESERAVRLAEEGLRANPSDIPLKNNLAFALFKLSRLSEARTILSSLPKHMSAINEGYINATSGYGMFKEGRYKIGRELYTKAIEIFNEAGTSRLVVKALLSLAIAEHEHTTANAIITSKEALLLSDTYTDPDILILRQIVSSYQTY